MEEAVTRAKASLGVHPNVSVDAQLYKLLLYGPGSHFKASSGEAGVPWANVVLHFLRGPDTQSSTPPPQPHRDTEKADGMFGTLVILLPSVYEVKKTACPSGLHPCLAPVQTSPDWLVHLPLQGGGLTVFHGGRMQRFDLASAKPECSCHYIAFYSGAPRGCRGLAAIQPLGHGDHLTWPLSQLSATCCPLADCRHEIQPITSGHRLALVYDLVHQGGSPVPRPPRSAATLALEQLAERWAGDSSAPDRLCYMLQGRWAEGRVCASAGPPLGSPKPTHCARWVMAQVSNLPCCLCMPPQVHS